LERRSRNQKELLPMKKTRIDLENAVVHIADSKTTNGIGDMPMTAEAREAFRRQIEETPGTEYLFPSPKSTGSKPYITSVRKGWAATLEKAGVPYFGLYELRHTFATRLSAGRVADLMVTQMLRQGDAEVFKLYSQAKLGMMREALGNLDRMANERPEIHSRSGRSEPILFTFFARSAVQRCGKGGRCCSERSHWSGRRDLNSGPLAPQTRDPLLRIP
jgi:hypothetical protein